MVSDIRRFAMACEKGDIETVTELIDILNFDQYNIYYIRQSIANGHLNILKILHQKGFPIESFCKTQGLRLAAIHGWVDIVDYFLSNFDETNDNILDIRNVAVVNGHLNILQYLHQKGCDIQCIYNRKSPLMLAAEYGWIDIIDYLLLNDVDINLETSNGHTALMIAVINKQIDVIDILLQNKRCQINLQDHNGYTAIFFALEKGYLQILHKLIANGSNIWHLNKLEESLLYRAVFVHPAYTDIDIINYLISLELDVNIQNIYGNTPLMWSAKCGNKEIVKILIENGADPTIKNMTGCTALTNARTQDIRDLMTKNMCEIKDI